MLSYTWLRTVLLAQLLPCEPCWYRDNQQHCNYLSVGVIVDFDTLYNQGYKDGLNSKKPTSDDPTYMLGHKDGWDDMLQYEYQRDRELGEER